MKVCFVSLYETTNFGDPILAYCAEWLFADEIKSKNVEIVRASLCWSNAQKNIKLNSGWHFLWKICKKLRLDKHKRWITIHEKHQLIIDNFASQIGNVDLYFITHDCFRAEYIADIFATAVTKGYNQSVRGNFRETIRNSIQNICDVFINNRYE